MTTGSGRISVATYARRIERAWGEALGQAVVLSPRDWSLVTEWHARGVPLPIVEEAIAAALERAARKGRAPRSGLGQLAPAVREAWDAVLDGRVAGPEPAAGDAACGVAPGDVWRGRIAQSGTPRALARTLAELLERLAAGADPAAIDAELDRRLPASVAPELLERVERAIERDLAPHRGRIEAASLAATRERARTRRLREELGLPRLAASRPPG